MAFDVNLCTFIGRLTRDPEPPRSFASSKVLRFGIAFVGQRKKDAATGKYEDDPCFLECEIWQYQNGLKSVDILSEHTKKGTQIYVRGRLKLETWEDKNGGGKRQAHKLVVEDFVILGGKSEGGSSGGSYGGSSYGGGKKPDAAPDGDPGDEYGSGIPDDIIPF